MASNAEIVLQVLRSRGTSTSKEIVDQTGLSKRAVSVAVGRLVENGDATRGPSGAITPKEKKS